MKRPHLLVFLLILITGSPVKSSTHSLDHNNNLIRLEIPPIQAQDDGDELRDDGGGDEIAGFEKEDDDGVDENEEDMGQFNFESENYEAQETEDAEEIVDESRQKLEDVNEDK